MNVCAVCEFLVYGEAQYLIVKCMSVVVNILLCNLGVFALGVSLAS